MFCFTFDASKTLCMGWPMGLTSCLLYLLFFKTNTPILRRAGVVWTTDRTILKIYSELVEISSAIVEISSELVEISSELVEISSETFSTIAELLIISTFKNTTKTVWRTRMSPFNEGKRADWAFSFIKSFVKTAMGATSSEVLSNPKCFEVMLRGVSGSDCCSEQPFQARIVT